MLLTVTAAVVIIMSIGFCGSTADGSEQNGVTEINPSRSEIIDLTAAFSSGIKRSQLTQYIVIHHTAGNPNGKINDIAKIHFGQQQWSTIGYHYFIDSDGVVYQLKPDDEVAPHSYHYNDNSVAICLSGNFNDYSPTKAQWESLLKITSQMLKKYGLQPTDVFKHGQLKGNNTECCGRKFNIELFREALK